MVAAMRRLLPYLAEEFPEYPKGREHRKAWEFAQLILGLEDLGALGPGAFVLSVGAGHEEPMYYLTNLARWVFACDLYGSSSFSGHEAQAGVLVDPDRYARCPYRRGRLVVQHMDARDLRFEDATFDVAYSLSSIEHFGGKQEARQALEEMRRVLRPGGLAAVATEVVVNGQPGWSEPGLELFSPEDLLELAGLQGLEPVEPVDFSVSPATTQAVVPLRQAVEDAARGKVDYPHLVLEHQGRLYTSVMLFLRRVPG
jgi:SAM-dependent methyltransferase